MTDFNPPVTICRHCFSRRWTFRKDVDVFICTGCGHKTPAIAEFLGLFAGRVEYPIYRYEDIRYGAPMLRVMGVSKNSITLIRD